MSRRQLYIKKKLSCPSHYQHHHLRLRLIIEYGKEPIVASISLTIALFGILVVLFVHTWLRSVLTKALK
jgi:hypothetical protein